LFRPSNGQNPEEPKNEKYSSKTYSFDVTKRDEIFDLLVNEGIIVVPKGLKMPPIEQRKRRGFCKFHCYLGHNTSRCVSLRDSVQKALDDGKLKFGDKSNKPMQIDADPLKQANSMYVEIVDVNVSNASILFLGNRCLSLNRAESIVDPRVRWSGIIYHLVGSWRTQEGLFLQPGRWMGTCWCGSLSWDGCRRR